MRCLSCQRQLFQSASETSDQKPRPADLNSLRAFSELPEGVSSPFADEVSFIVRELYFGSPTCQAARGETAFPTRELHFAGLAKVLPGGALVVLFEARFASNSFSFLAASATSGAA